MFDLGYKVLYCSMEMSERDISHRIYSNLIKTPLHEIKSMDRERFLSRLDQVKSKGIGSFKTIQFTTIASTMNFKMAMNELKTKHNWMPDIVIVDYLGITSSYRVPRTASNQSYSILTSVSEELRDLAIELDIVVWSAQQLNRQGAGSSDSELTDIAGSFGITGTIDFAALITRNEELDSLGKISCKQLKNRYHNTTYRPRFLLGCEFDKMLLSDVNEPGIQKPDEDPEPRHDSKSLQEMWLPSKNTKRRFRSVDGIDMSDSKETE